LQCTYIEIPQVEETLGVFFLSKPAWIWGCEMGVNECGVVIGNEAIVTKVTPSQEKSLLGMDYARLALERGKSAREALEVITSLMPKYGQGGNCAYNGELFYDNSYIIAYIEEAWIVETVGKQWAAKKVIDIGSISNAPTITSCDLTSSDLVSIAVKKGGLNKVNHLIFAKHTNRRMPLPLLERALREAVDPRSY